MVASFTDWDKDPNYLAHFGTKGMKWGQRRYQNPDGSLTSLGKERYGSGGKASARRMTKDLNKLDKERANAQYRANRYGRKIAKKDARYAKKIAGAEKVGNEKKAAKLKAKQEGLIDTRAGKKATRYSELVRKDQAMANQILSRAKAAGMSVKSRGTIRSVNKGKAFAKGLGLAGAGVLGYAALQGSMARRGVGATGIGINGKGITIKAHKGPGQAIYDLGKKMQGATVDIGKGISLNRAGKFVANNAGKLGIAAAGGSALAGGKVAGAIMAPKVKGTKYKVKKAKRG